MRKKIQGIKRYLLSPKDLCPHLKMAELWPRGFWNPWGRTVLVSILTALTEHTSDMNSVGTVIRGREGTATYGSVVGEAQRLDP